MTLLPPASKIIVTSIYATTNPLYPRKTVVYRSNRNRSSTKLEVLHLFRWFTHTHKLSHATLSHNSHTHTTYSHNSLTHNSLTQLFVWQAWHSEASTSILGGRLGTWRHRPSLCVAGVALMILGWLWWSTSGDAAPFSCLCTLVALVALGLPDPCGLPQAEKDTWDIV